MTAKELKSLLNVLKEAGVTSYKTPELELTIDPSSSTMPLIPSKTPLDASELKAPLTGAPSPEDILFWSSQDGV